MLKKITIVFIILSTLSLGKINDYRGAFLDEDKVKLEKTVESFEKGTGNKFFLNTLEENEGFEADSQERLIILNLIKNKEDLNSTLKVQIKISQDLNPEELSTELTLLLDNVQEYANQKDEFQIANNLVEGLQQLFIAEDESEDQNENSGQLELGLKIFLGILLTFLVLWIRIIQVKQKKIKYKLKRR